MAVGTDLGHSPIHPPGRSRPWPCKRSVESSHTSHHRCSRHPGRSSYRDRDHRPRCPQGRFRNSRHMPPRSRLNRHPRHNRPPSAADRDSDRRLCHHLRMRPKRPRSLRRPGPDRNRRQHSRPPPAVVGRDWDCRLCYPLRTRPKRPRSLPRSGVCNRRRQHSTRPSQLVADRDWGRSPFHFLDRSH